MARNRGSSDCKVFVGDLGADASKEELEAAFGYYGRLRDVWVARNPPGFAFVEFEDPRDAEDAVRDLDGKRLCGHRIRVEVSTGRAPRTRRGGGAGGGYGGGGRRVDSYGGGDRDRCYRCNRPGHFAYECERLTGGYSGGARGRSPPPRRGRSRSYSRSRSPVGRRSRSASGSRSPSRSRSPPPVRGGAAANAGSSSGSRSASGSRSPSPAGRRGRAEPRRQRRGGNTSPTPSGSRSPSKESRDSRSRSPRGRNGRQRSPSGSDSA